MAEELYARGTELISSLKEMLDSDADVEAKVHAAAILLELGSHAGIPFLLETLKDKDWCIFAANRLGKFRITAAQPGIESLLRAWDIKSDPYNAGSLVWALKRTGPIPEDLRRKLLKESPVYMAGALQDRAD